MTANETAILECEKNAGKLKFTRQTLGQPKVTFPPVRVLIWVSEKFTDRSVSGLDELCREQRCGDASHERAPQRQHLSLTCGQVDLCATGRRSVLSRYVVIQDVSNVWGWDWEHVD